MKNEQRTTPTAHKDPFMIGEENLRAPLPIATRIEIALQLVLLGHPIIGLRILFPKWQNHPPSSQTNQPEIE